MLTKRFITSYPKRGDIVIADLRPSFGREIHKKRPVLVISTNTLNQVLPTVIIIPFSSIVPQFIGPDVVLFTSQRGLDKKSALIVNQLRAIDKDRLVGKAGHISKGKMREVEEALRVVLNL